MALPIAAMSPLSERGKPLLWRNGRLHSNRTPPRRLRSGCVKMFYRCKHDGCPGTITLTETEAHSGDYIENGEFLVSCAWGI